MVCICTVQTGHSLFFSHSLDSTGVNCTETFDICSPNPCENGGECIPTYGGHYYECSCRSNYGGQNCEYLVDPCLVEGVCGEGQTCFTNSSQEPNGLYNVSTVVTECLTCGVESHDHCSSAPCGNNGTCRSLLHSYVCDCYDGFTGVNCSVTDHCTGNTCSSHSTRCVNLPEESTFLCRCMEGWEGVLCDHDVNECALDPGRCNGGSCVNRLGGYSCENCPPDRTGTNCEMMLTCDDVTCQNGGTCSDSGGVATCSCQAGFTGLMCESEGE